MARPRIAVHKFSSCDGCQLAFLNAGEALLQLAELVDIRHFLEAGLEDEDAEVDIAFVEGSISTEAEAQRIRKVRESSRHLVVIGACATSGGLQALRNLDQSNDAWRDAIYAHPQYIDSLAKALPISAHVRVDHDIWGCPVNGAQVLAVARQLLNSVQPTTPGDTVCAECKRSGAVCVMVGAGKPCLGPVTRSGCGALCPRYGRDCYGCFGPAQNLNGKALAAQFARLGLSDADIARRFLFINSQAPDFLQTGAAHYKPGFGDD